MEALMRQETEKVVSDHRATTGIYDGIIYVMHTRGADGGVVPCYIGKSETVGKASGVLSANLVRLATDTSKFGRWGDNYAYHIGDLSSIVLPGHDATVQREKYRSWATALFEGTNTDRPRLRRASDGLYTDQVHVTGAGRNIWGTEDGFQFYYQKLIETETLIGRLINIPNDSHVNPGQKRA
jgi:hypothetical protein